MALGRYKPYPAYKPSGVEWLGDIPEGWEAQKLKFIAENSPSNVDKKTREGEVLVGLCNYTDVYYSETINANENFMRATATQDQVEKFTLRAGDTIITKDSEDPDDIAVPAFVPKDLDGIVCGYHLSLIRPFNADNGAFLKRCFECGFARSYFSVNSNGLTRYGLGSYPLNNVVFPTPSSAEQIKIAAFLDHETAKIDALIAKQQRLIALLEEKRQAVISHAVTKGLDKSAPLRPSGIDWLGDVPAHWEVKRLGNLFRESNTRASTEKELEFPILSVSIHHGISDKELNETELDRKITRSDDRSLYKVVHDNDLAYNMMRAWQGGFGASTLNGLVSPAYVVCNPASQLPSSYFELVLRTSNAVTELKRFSRGITDFRLRLYWDEFKNICVPVPPSKEVANILEVTAKITTKYAQLKVKAQSAITLLKERRTALISAAVTGKIDLRDWTPPEASQHHTIRDINQPEEALT